MKNLPRERDESRCSETKQGQREWMADDFPDLLRLECNSSILFMGNFPMTTQYVPLFLSYMNVSLLLLLFCKTPGPGSYLLISLEVLSPSLTPPPTGL